jgi:hypothetical protein
MSIHEVVTEFHKCIHLLNSNSSARSGKMANLQQPTARPNFLELRTFKAATARRQVNHIKAAGRSSQRHIFIVINILPLVGEICCRTDIIHV